MPTTTKPAPLALTLKPARDGGYTVATFEGLTDQQGRPLFAGHLGDCLAYIAAHMLGQDPADVVGTLAQGYASASNARYAPADASPPWSINRMPG